MKKEDVLKKLKEIFLVSGYEEWFTVSEDAYSYGTFYGVGDVLGFENGWMQLFYFDDVLDVKYLKDTYDGGYEFRLDIISVMGPIFSYYMNEQTEGIMVNLKNGTVLTDHNQIKQFFAEYHKDRRG